MKPDQSIEIQLSGRTDQPVSLGNVVVEIHFFTGGRYRYAFKVGRTDEAGHLSIPYREIERVRRENAVENLMDYNTKLEDCDPTVKIVVPSEGQLRQQYDRAVRAYQQPPAWAAVWPSNGKVLAEDKSIQLAEPVNQVRVSVSLNNDSTADHGPSADR
jgi:hypothetical protein